MLPHLSSAVAAMVRLQLLTGMRPGEVCGMRGRDLDTAAAVWTHAPEHHKTAHRGHAGTICLGMKARVALRAFLKPNLSTPLFSPAEAEAERREKVRVGRATPLSCGNRPGTNRKRPPRVTPGDRYDVGAYRRAVRRACDRAFPAPDGLTGAGRNAWAESHRFHPHQLRHTAATRIRKEHGLEVAQAVLGHRHA